MHVGVVLLCDLLVVTRLVKILVHERMNNTFLNLSWTIIKKRLNFVEHAPASNVFSLPYISSMIEVKLKTHKLLALLNPTETN